MPAPAERLPPAAIELAAQLSRVPGISGLTLGGSHARATADSLSDIDIGLYYRAADPPAPTDLRRLAAELRATSALVTEHGEWGPWIEGGGWLEIDGRRVDWLYRNLDRIEGVIEDCLAGRIASAYQPGHPHGFHSHIHFGEVALGLILHDPTGRLSEAQARTRPYPAALRDAIRERFGWQARFALDIAAKSARRGDVAHVSGCLFVAVGCLLQVLYAANERPFLNEKGALREAAGFGRAPRQLQARVERALALGAAGPTGSQAVYVLAELAGEIEVLA